ncbi:MAG TPA: biotin/lipoyl-containing protein [Ilumatobacter sp.]|nr:biotin/lipoyl-containing protein [Ilumatobacter sp.]
MSSAQDAIKRVVEAFERSDWSEIDVRAGNVRVHLSASPAGTTTAAITSPDPTVPADPFVTGRSTPGDAGVDLPASEGDAGEPSSALQPPVGAHVVVSPSPGILWRSPEPGLPPFAEVGDTVDASSTVCIVEVMKLMNHVKAGVAGEVITVYGANGASVHKGEALFAIALSGSPS